MMRKVVIIAPEDKVIELYDNKFAEMMKKWLDENNSTLVIPDYCKIALIYEDDNYKSVAVFKINFDEENGHEE